jgi:hypothetical protein
MPRVQINLDCIVEGKHCPAGSVVEVSAEDAAILSHAGRHEVLEAKPEEGEEPTADQIAADEADSEVPKGQRGK